MKSALIIRQEKNSTVKVSVECLVGGLEDAPLNENAWKNATETW